MAINEKDFFSSNPIIQDYNEEDYQKIKSYIDFAKSISQLTYQSIYLIDYYKKGFLYVSENPIFLVGKSSKDVLNDGYMHYINNVPQGDLSLLLNINKEGFSFYNDISYENRLKYSISYDFHLNQLKGKPILVNHKLKPLILDNNFNPWIALCIVSISTHKKAGNIFIRNDEDKIVFEFDLGMNKWIKSDKIFLKQREKDILLYSAQGLTMNQISDKLFISIDTIKFHKKKIFSKLKVNSITEATALAIEFGLF